MRGVEAGALHGREIFYLFDSWRKIPKEELPPDLDLEAIMTDEDRHMSRIMRQCWIAFARDGIPRCDGVPEWPRYHRDHDQLMEFGVNVQVRENFRKKQLDAHEKSMDHGMTIKHQGALTLIKEIESEVDI